MAIPYQGGASIDENGNAYGGKDGDQKDEVRKRKWYIHSKGWRIFRAKDPRVRKAIAYATRRAIVNQNIGYNQWRRYTLQKLAREVGYDPGKVKTPCACDCSTLMYLACCYAFAQIGIDFESLVILQSETKGDFRTGNMKSRLMATGLFEMFEDDKHCARADGAYLMEGDIAVTPTSGHTIALLTDGDRAYDDDVSVSNPYPEPTYLLRKGRAGTPVKWVQWHLKRLGYDLGKWGIDGDLGPLTDAAVRAFQLAQKIEVDGIVGPITRKHLKAA
jgi:hypothetical protein